MAASREDGTCVVWNLRKSAVRTSWNVAGELQIFNMCGGCISILQPWTILRDPQNNPISCVAWSPNDGVYLITATDADAQ